MSVNIHFAGPDFSPLNTGPESWDIVVDSFDLDYGVLTVDPDDAVGSNDTLAVHAPMCNEEGFPLGTVGWRIEPDAFLCERMPNIDWDAIEGAVFGRVIVTDAQTVVC